MLNSRKLGVKGKGQWSRVNGPLLILIIKKATLKGGLYCKDQLRSVFAQKQTVAYRGIEISGINFTITFFGIKVESIGSFSNFIIT